MRHATHIRSIVGLITSMMILLWTNASAVGESLPEDPIVVIVHPSNPVTGLQSEELRLIFLKKRRIWTSGKRIVPFNLAPGNTTRRAFDSRVLGMNDAESGAYWVRFKSVGEGSPPRALASGRLASRMVAALPEGIGYARLSQVDASVKVLRVDGRTRDSQDYLLGGYGR